MARFRRFPPYPSKPHATGRARIHYNGRDIYLPGEFGSKESRAEYARLAAEWAKGEPQPERDPNITVAQVVRLWQTEGVKAEYEPDSREPANYVYPLRVLVRVCGSLPASEFDASRLIDVRDAMVSGSWLSDGERAERVRMQHPIGWSRKRVNREIVRVRTVWRWAGIKRLVPETAWAGLLLVKGPKRGRITQPREPVAWDAVQKVLPHLEPTHAAMVQVQWHTGMRPGEVCKMRPCDVDRSGAVWIYRLESHKTDHHERAAAWNKIAIGPRSQAVIQPWLAVALSRGDDAYIFPATLKKWQTPCDTNNYGQAIRRVCDQLGIQRWTPYQLRHSAKQRIAREFKDGSARAVLRHMSLSTTNGYAAQQDLEEAIRVAKEAG